MKRLVLVALLLPACVQQNIEQAVELRQLDANFYRCEVQPVLAAQCSFMACHGNDERPLMLYAEQRFRLGVSWEDYKTSITDEELAANLKMVEGFVSQNDSDVNLLRDKALDTRAGGLFHRGKDQYGTDDVFLDRQDPGYRVLEKFSAGAVADDDCTEREEVRP